MPTIELESFGYGWGQPPFAHLTYDVREHFRDPHVKPELRYLTANDNAVINTVLDTSGIPELITGIMATVIAYTMAPKKQVIRVAIGCVGGRHRSAVIANVLAIRFKSVGYTVTIIHRDIDKEVIERSA